MLKDFQFIRAVQFTVPCVLFLILSNHWALLVAGEHNPFFLLLCILFGFTTISVWIRLNTILDAHYWAAAAAVERFHKNIKEAQKVVDGMIKDAKDLTKTSKEHKQGWF